MGIHFCKRYNLILFHLRKGRKRGVAEQFKLIIITVIDLFYNLKD